MKPDLEQLKQASVVDLKSLAANPSPIVEETRGFIAPRVAKTLILLTEAVAIALAALGTLALYPGMLYAEPFANYASIIAAMTLAFPLAAQAAGLYHLDAILSPPRSAPKLVSLWLLLLAAIAMATVAFKTGDSLSRGWLITWGIAGLGWMLLVRSGIAALSRRLNANGQFNRRAVIVGGGAEADMVIETLQKSGDTGITLLGMFDDRRDDRSPDVTRGLRKLGTIEELVAYARRTRVDTLIVTLPVHAEARLLQIISRLWILPVDIRLSAHSQKLRYRPRAYSHIGNLALLDVFDRPLGDWGPLLKSIEDKLIASVALVLLSPVMLAVALAVKLGSKGPVFFRQRRYGFNNELIEVYKFRSMYTDMADADARKLVSKDDPRVTPIGRFIRKTTLDELPQLFNVLKGELSLVGPRPHATRASAAGTLYENAVNGYFARHKVKPGMTGWAQINGWRGETDTEEKIRNRVEHDLFYIENWSLTFDLYILARTPLALLNTKNAY
ncbi:MAG: undecaprenyl-phosphate glucose phosphotransferase [Hyphomicrobiales bacterium]